MRALLVSVAVALAVGGVVLATSGSDDDHLPETTPARAPEVAELIGDPSQPYPFTTPVPPRAPTVLDGVYARRLSVQTAGGRPVPCRRCAPYRLEAGRAELLLSEGQFFLDHEAAGFASLGHFRVSGDEIVLFNDPNCPTTSGTYDWTLQEGLLTLTPVDDDCPYADLRARYLGAVPWNRS